MVELQQHYEWEKVLQGRLALVYINGHGYLFDTYGHRFLEHDQNCPCYKPQRAMAQIKEASDGE